MTTSTIAIENGSVSAAELKTEILALVRQYSATVPAEGRCDAVGLAALIESLLDAETGGGRYAERFEDKLTELFGAREALLVNSGASANLVAVSSLTSPRMGKLRLKAGDEVITLASGSSSLTAAIVQNQLAPVFVDLSLPGFNVDVRQLQGALASRTRAIALPHLCGNPFDLDAVTMFAAFNNLLLIEDCRDAAGAIFGGRSVGCFGQFGTASFRDGRQLATGEGGAVLASAPLYRSIAESFRDGGRGDSAGGARTHAGYNLRATEMQAALGAAQVAGLAARLDERSNNAMTLIDGLAGLAEHIILPESLRAARPSWLELPIAIRESARFTRDRLLQLLAAGGIAARPFSPALPAHPAFENCTHRTVGALPVSHFLATNGLLVKVPPCAGQADVTTIVETFHSAVNDLR